MAVQVGPDPIQTTCPKCRATIITSVEEKKSTKQWLCCCLLCIVGCDLGCCLIPFCVDDWTTKIHTCPECKTFIGKYSSWISKIIVILLVQTYSALLNKIVDVF